MSLSTGVAAGAGAIEISQWLHGDASLGTRDFSLAFYSVALVSMASALVFSRLPAGAGDALRGSGPPRVAASLTPTDGLGDQPSAVLEIPRNPVART